MQQPCGFAQGHFSDERSPVSFRELQWFSCRRSAPFISAKSLGGGKFLLVGDSIEMQFQSAYNYNLGASLSLVVMLMIIICMLVMNRL